MQILFRKILKKNNTTKENIHTLQTFLSTQTSQKQD